MPFGVAVWALGYIVLRSRLYRPIWKYDAETLAKDLGAHLAYGADHRNRILAARQVL